MSYYFAIMSYPARVYRVFVASPADVADERQLAARVIQEWNDIHSSRRGIVLLPVRWETHAAPELGERPQAILNRQVVDDCDVLVAIFWTRIGTPSSEGGLTGTVEEIERAVARGKRVLVYFSRKPAVLDDVDLTQAAQLRNFKSQLLNRGLVADFSDPVDFYNRFTKQLELAVRALLERDQIAGHASDERTTIDLQLALADVHTGAPIGATMRVEPKLVTYPDFSEVPDYVPKEDKSSGIRGIYSQGVRGKDYFREWLRSLQQQLALSFVRMALTNAGTIGIRDIFVDLRVESAGRANILCVDESRLTFTGALTFPPHWARSATALPFESDDSSSWKTQLEVAALQPRRSIAPFRFSIGAEENAVARVRAMIYADVFADPQEQTLEIEILPQRVEASALEMLKHNPPPD